MYKDLKKFSEPMAEHERIEIIDDNSKKNIQVLTAGVVSVSKLLEMEYKKPKKDQDEKRIKQLLNEFYSLNDSIRVKAITKVKTGDL